MNSPTHTGAVLKDRAGLDDLIKDAQLVALFGQRTGQLPDNSLQSSIAGVVRKREASWGDEEVVRLQEAINRAVNAIRPVTLLDLGQGWNPFRRPLATRVWLSTKNLIFIAFAFLLIVAASISTYVLNTGNMIVQALEELHELEPQRRIGDLQRQLLNAQPSTENMNSPEALLAQEAYFRTLDDLRDIDRNLNLYIPLAENYVGDYKNPFRLTKNMVKWAWTGDWPSPYGMPSVPPGPPAIISATAAGVMPQPEAAGPTRQPADAGAARVTPVAGVTRSGPSAQAPGTEGAPGTTEPAQIPIREELPIASRQGGGTYSSEVPACLLAQATQNGSTGAFGKTQVGRMLAQYELGALELSCYQRLSYQPGTVPSIRERLSRMNQIISLYALWILPAIYGALGATIFYMRSILDPLLPDPGFSNVLLRVALGALAGIILGWFWTPETTLGTEITKIGFSLFAMAFLFGFSIDVFFAMLDRFVRFGRDFFEQIGSGKVKPAEQQVST